MKKMKSHLGVEWPPDLICKSIRQNIEASKFKIEKRIVVI